MVKFNLKLAPKKTNLGVKVVTFLGHQVTAEGIHPCPEKGLAECYLRGWVQSWVGESRTPWTIAKVLWRRRRAVSRHCVLQNPGQYERLLGNEPVRTYVPMMLRPWVMDCSHKEAVHLGWQFARVTQVEESGSTRVTHTLKLLDIGRNINVELEEAKLTTDELVLEPGTWCWHAHITQKDVKKYMHALQ
ncbi:unnamed protein product [Pylaiella littoralis]